MNVKKAMVIVLCVLLTTVIVMAGVAIGRVGWMIQGLLHSGITAKPSGTPGSSASSPSVPSQPSVPSSTPTQPSTGPTSPTESTPTHNYVLSETIPATCEGMGYSIYICSDCGKENYQDFVEAYGHSFGTGTLIEPTCTENGATRHTCLRCGMISDRNITEALGHDPVFVETVPGNCEVIGYDLYICSRCDEEIHLNESETPGHTFLPVGETIPPTCTEDGVTLLQCTLCGIQQEERIPATGHSFGPWETNDGGTLVRVCSLCGTQEHSESLKITQEHVSVSKNDSKIYLIYVGSDSEPRLFYFAIWDYLNNGTLTYFLDPMRGLVVTYTDAQGTPVEICRPVSDGTAIIIPAE